MDTRVGNLAIVAAVAENDIIGRDNKIPWRLSSDMARFKSLTSDSMVIMGRKTYESLPKKFQPLPDRVNIVISSQKDYNAPGCTVVHSFQEALAVRGDARAFIIGGSMVYIAALPLVNQLYITLVHTQPEGDVRFPPIRGWVMSHYQRFTKDKNNQHDYTFAIFERRPQPSMVYLSNAREVAQWINMEQIFRDNVCPFCPEHLLTYHTPPIIRETDNWVVTANQYPYENTRVHLLLIRREHAERLSELNANDWRDIGELVQWAEREYKIGGGGFGFRFGNPALNGATVKHLHAHLLTANISDPSDPAYKSVRLKVG